MEIGYLVAGVLTLVILVVTSLLMRWRNPSCNGKLPPGCLGLPVIGETFQFLTAGSSLDCNPFVSTRIKRYGTIFKTNIMGGPVVVSADEEFNEMVFQQHGKLFDTWFPDSMDKIIRVSSIREGPVAAYKYLKNTMRAYFGPKRLREALMADFTKLVRARLALWAQLPSVELTETISTMLFDSVATELFGFAESSSTLEDLRKNIFTLRKAFNSVPLYIPGTQFYRCLKGRKAAIKILKETLKQRMSTPEVQYGDIWDVVVQELTREEVVFPEWVFLDLFLALLTAVFDVNTQSFICAVRLLTDNAQVVKKLEEEHEEIMKKVGERQDSEITWEDYKSMRYTSQVVNEIHRLGSIAPGIFRKVVNDVEYKGYTIPKGWKVMIYTPAIHLDPEIYEDPFSFNPSRWQDRSDDGRAFKHFRAFGFGQHFCAGADYSLLLLSIFLHCLITNYRWKIVKGGTVSRSIGLNFPEGFRIQLIPKHNI